MAASCGERRRLEALLSLSMSWMTPTLWQAVHDREHHQNTNDLRDPDRAYLQALPRNWGKRRSEERLVNLPLQQP